jgi:hypothetical protein
MRAERTLSYFEAGLGDYVLSLKNDPADGYARMQRQRLENLHAFLLAFPRLIESRADEPAQLLGKPPTYSSAHSLHAFPLQDHSFYWRVRGVRGPVLCATYPYEHASNDTCRAEMIRYVDTDGFVVEVAPPDLPDLWYPGRTIPIAWSRRGVDWRGLGKC